MTWRPAVVPALIALAVGVAVPAGAAEAGDPLVQAYRQRCEALMEKRLGGVHKIILGADGWLLLTPELKFASSTQFWGIAALALKPDVPIDRADPVSAIAAFQKELARHGIELLFALAPDRAVVVPEAVLGKDALPVRGSTPRLQPLEVEFYAALRAQGVAVLDLTPVFLAHRNWEHAPLYVPSDPHWTGAGVVLGAQEMAAWVRRQPWAREAPTQRFQATWKSVEHFGPLYKDLFERDGLEKRAPDTVQCRSIRGVDGAGAATEVAIRNPASPVILIGDSHTVWWNHDDGALYQQLAFELGFPVDTLNTNGGGTNESRLNLVRYVRTNPGYLTGKKAVIWCFSSRDLLGNKDGWIRTPLEP